mgnify:FL=1
MEKIKISIVTICYNSGSTIEDTIKSVLSQNYPNLDYVIIDGASTDDTMNIVNRYRNKFSVVVSEKDGGISDAFNKGIANSSGEVICFMNSDDVMLPGALDAIAQAYDGKHDIYCGNVLLENPNTGFKCREVPSVNFPIVPVLCHVAHQGMFITKKAYNHFGGYDTNVRYPMDLDFLMRASRKGATFKHVDYDIACFRAGGTTSNNIFKKKKDYLYIVRKNGGNAIQAYYFYYFLVMTQFVKRILNIFGENFSQKLRYKYSK